ncbi:MAG: chorismate-binding protein, partial [Cyclobacteriaceae bacterium]|nr:chorismate-binding protein [Cyclobacteriaceae bacterium]
MKKYKLKIQTIDLLADTLTPVGIYLQVRDKYANSILLESTDYHGNENSCSYICCNPIASIVLDNNELSTVHPDGVESKKKEFQLVDELQQFINQFEVEGDNKEEIGMYGYHCYDAVQHFETISFKEKSENIPVLHYAMYSYVVVINHFNSTLKIIHVNVEEGEESINDFVTLIKQANHPKYNFSLPDKEETNYTDDEYLSIVSKGIDHCKKGDVFQIVLSRQFQQSFQGDEFNVYRALRAVNPSPYLFYFDYGSFRLMGSSPEAQIVVKNNKATINPIAGTFRRTGNDVEDAELAKKLGKDEKENAEHVMLVDLARN